MDKDTSVYRYYDRDKVLLYVGITSRGQKRNTEHFPKSWWKYVAEQMVEHFPDRATALKEESRLIAKYQPPFNTQQNPDHADSRDAYIAFAKYRDETSSTAVTYLVQDWYDAEVVKVDGKTLVLVIDDPAASHATRGAKVNVTGKGTHLAKCYGMGGKLYLVVTKRSGWIGQWVNGAKVKMARPATGAYVKAIDLDLVKTA